MMRLRGSLQDFDNIPDAYRAEIEFNGTLYKFWKEHAVSRRLELFRINTPFPVEPYVSHRYLFWDDLQKDIPAEIWESDNWEIFTVIRSLPVGE